jgi:hypothetical protein
MKHEYNPYVGEIIEPPHHFFSIKGRYQFDTGRGIGDQAGLPGSAKFFSETGVNNTDGIECEYHETHYTADLDL